MQRSGGRLVFNQVMGVAEVYLDGVKAGVKDDPGPWPLTVALPPRSGVRTVVVLMSVPAHQSYGLGGSVLVQGPG